jgi:hypothetical protein
MACVALPPNAAIAMHRWPPCHAIRRLTFKPAFFYYGLTNSP